LAHDERQQPVQPEIVEAASQVSNLDGSEEVVAGGAEVSYCDLYIDFHVNFHKVGI